MNKTQQIIEDAERILRDNPYDEGHDIKHHNETRKLAFKIADKEKLEIDKEALEIACMWHDVMIIDRRERKLDRRNIIIKETVDYLREKLEEYGFKKNRIKLIFDAVLSHEFANRQKTLEAKLLFDADKLCTISSERLTKIVEAHENGKISDIKFKLYVKLGKYRLKTLRKRLHFAYSKNLYDRKIEILKKNKYTKQLVEDFGVRL